MRGLWQDVDRKAVRNYEKRNLRHWRTNSGIHRVRKSNVSTEFHFQALINRLEFFNHDFCHIHVIEIDQGHLQTNRVTWYWSFCN
jgi:hypothetical protein